MKSILKFSIIPLFVLLLSSCNDVIQVKLDEGSKLYVIDAFVNDLRSNQTIRVTTNDSYFSDREAPPVGNANVVLLDLTTSSQYTFNYAGNGNYVYNLASTDTISKPNHQYQLNVTIDGNLYTSLVTTQKRPAIIDSISAIENDGSNSFAGKKGTYNCLLFARDLGGSVPDYYWIKAYRNDTLFNAPADINTCIDGTGGAVNNPAVDTIFFTPPATFLGFKEYLLGQKCKAEVHSVTRETYFFLVQAIAQINNGGLFATTPENVKTNIITPSAVKTKSIGWFSMASVASKTKIITS
jgi:hypothetical protein